MRRARAVAALAVAWAASGCATLVQRTAPDPVELTSDPPGAEVVVTDEAGLELARGAAPLRVELAASEGYFDAAEYYVDYALECHEPVRLVLQARVEPWYFGNLLFPGLIGYALVDPLSGAMWRLDERASARLRPRSDPDCVDVAAPPPAPAATVRPAAADPAQPSPNTSP